MRNACIKRWIRPISRSGILFSSILILYCIFTVPPVTAIRIDRILAVVNEKIISLSDVEAYQVILGEGRSQQTVLQELIDQRLLLGEASKFKFTEPSAKAVETALRQLEDGWESREKLDQMLAQLNISQEDLQNLIKTHITATEVIHQRINFFVFVSPDEIERYYQQHTDEFSGLPFDQAQLEIQDVLNRKKAETKRKEYLDRLRARAKILIN